VLSPIFQLDFTVLESDIDPLGHASNIAYVRWVQDVAVAHSGAVGLDYGAYQRLGAIFVIRRHEIDYLRPALRGDRIEARTWVRSVMAAKCERATELTRLSDRACIAKALTTWGYIDVTNGRPTRIPEHVKSAFAQEQPPEGAVARPWPGS
jgi:acyl-CoA thioester hydrolase